jgi:hypothetical protein
MKGFWINFTDGSKGYCEGQSPYDAVRIAEKITGKTAVAGDHEYNPTLKTLPYPANPVIWQFDHPVVGKCPPFCYKPDSCSGNTSCPRNPCCTS